MPAGHGGVTAWCCSSASPSSAHAAATLPCRWAQARAWCAAPDKWSLAMPATGADTVRDGISYGQNCHVWSENKFDVTVRAARADTTVRLSVAIATLRTGYNWGLRLVSGLSFGGVRS